MASGSENVQEKEHTNPGTIIIDLENESLGSKSGSNSRDPSPSTAGKQTLVEQSDEQKEEPRSMANDGANVVMSNTDVLDSGQRQIASPSDSGPNMEGKRAPVEQHTEQGEEQPSTTNEEVHHSRNHSSSSSSSSEDTKTPVEKLDQALEKLQVNDDVQNFIGLQNLTLILNSNEELQKDPQVIARCWAAVPSKFLDFLLSAADDESDRTITRDCMIALAVAVIHRFASRLPESSRNDEKFAGRVGGLLTALKIDSFPETQHVILRTLVLLGSTSQGSSALLEADGWFTVPKLAAEHETALEVIEHVYAVAAAEAGDISISLPKLHETMSVLTDVFLKTANPTSLFESLNKLVEFVPDESPEHAIWLSPVTQLLLQSTTNTRCADRSRLTHAVVLLSASLIRTFPAESSSLLFSSQLAVPFGNTSKPVSWLFVQHRLVDIRSSIPSLPEKLNGPEYKVVSERLAECYVIISAFTGFFMGGATNDKENDYSEVLPFTRDLTDILLKTLSDACSVTVDYLCERYAAGPNQMRRDPFTKAQLRMLAMWLPKDDGTKLRDGPVSILDVTFGLYGEQEDTRMPILMITEQATSHPSGVDKFHRNGGWVVLFHELESIIELPSPSQQTHSNGVLILDILRKVATHDIEAGNAHEHWMDVVRLACKLDTEGSAEGLDLKYQMAALAAEFYELFLQSGKERRPGTLKQLLKVVSRLLTKRGRVGETTVGELEEAMENLRLLKGNSG